MPAAARGTNGTVLEVSISSVDTAIGLLESLKPPKSKVMTERLEPLDADHSTPIYTGRVDAETAEFGVYLDLLDTAHSHLLKIAHDPTETDAGALKTWTATFPIAGLDPWIFTGILEAFQVSVEKASLMKGTGTIQVDESTGLPVPTA